MVLPNENSASTNIHILQLLLVCKDASSMELTVSNSL